MVNFKVFQALVRAATPFNRGNKPWSHLRAETPINLHCCCL
jgi:hypothetical protein